VISISIYLINVIIQIISLLVIVHVVLSYFMSPFHPIRQLIDRLVEPMLSPIRRIVPSVGMLDLSPLILLILVQVLGQLLGIILRSL
jgi:YggT family protein